MATAEATSMLDVQSLSAGYLGTPVVRDLSLRVDAGEVVALFGPNGAGKTTTLSAIAGLIAPLDGTVRFADEDATGRARAPARARGRLAWCPRAARCSSGSPSAST